MKILIAIPRKDIIDTVFNEAALKKMNALSTSVDWVDTDTPYTSEQLAKAAKEYDVIFSSWGSPRYTEDVIKGASKLKFTGHIAGSMVHVFDPAIFQTDIVSVNANRVLAFATAELAVALMIAGSWDLHGFQVRMGQGLWSKTKTGSVPGLAGQTIGIIGYGEISKEVMRLLKPFHNRFLVYSSYCPQEEAEKNGFTLCDLDSLLQQSDIVSLHNTLTSKTKGMIDKKKLDMIKDGALLVNTARGAIIKQDDLIESLKENRYFAALDVYEQEPLPTDSELLKLENVTCTPHIGALSKYYKSTMALAVVDDLERWTKNEPLHGHVDLEKYERMTRG